MSNISIRGDNVREITLKAIEGIENAIGGGHEKATGAKIPSEKLPLFKKRFEEMVEK